jgi:hypothetical protein
MLEQYFWNRVLLEKIEESHLRKYIEKVAEFLNGENCRRKYIASTFSPIARFGSWLNDRRIAIDEISNEHMEKFFSENHIISNSNNAKAGIRLAVSFIHQDFIPYRTPAQIAAESFREFLLSDCGFCERYALDHSRKILAFLTFFFHDTTISLRSLTPCGIEQYIRSIPGTRANSRRKQTSQAIRSYLGFCEIQGLNVYDLYLGIPFIRSLPRPELPRQLSDSEKNLFISSINRSSSKGKWLMPW